MKYLVIYEEHAVIEADGPDEAIELYYEGEEIVKEGAVQSVLPLYETDSPLRDFICE